MTIEDEVNKIISDRLGPVELRLNTLIKSTIESHIAAMHGTPGPTPGPTPQPNPIPNPVPTPINPSGVAAPAHADYQGWKIQGVYDFNETTPIGSWGPRTNNVPPVYSKLRVYEDGWYDTAGKPDVNNRPSRYHPTTVLETKNGMLIKRLYDNGQGTRSAAVAVGGNQMGGRYSIRARMNHDAGAPGWKVAWLHWPQNDSDWPKFGEIDYPEASIRPGATVAGYLHVQNGGAQGQGQMHFSDPALLSQWHTYDTEWLPPGRLSPSHPGFVRHYLDGRLIFNCTDGTKVPAGPMHWVIQTESNIGGPYTAAGSRATVEIDWLAWWSSAV